HHPLGRLDLGRKLIHRELRSGRVALLFGSEKVGLSNEDFSHCDWLLRMPTRYEHSSMNLGQAVAVCLYELARGRDESNISQSQKPPRQQRASAAEVERIAALLLETLHASGYLKPNATRAAEAKVRRLVRRLNLDAEDAEVWLGIFRPIAWKITAAHDNKK